MKIFFGGFLLETQRKILIFICCTNIYIYIYIYFFFLGHLRQLTGKEGEFGFAGERGRSEQVFASVHHWQHQSKGTQEIAAAKL